MNFAVFCVAICAILSSVKATFSNPGAVGLHQEEDNVQGFYEQRPEDRSEQRREEHGCYQDGVTIPQGPLNYGCHCSQSEFKCCSDEVTPAKGPNFEGCTCSTSKYGCCPDGHTDAQGSNFDGCEDIPKTPQKSCSLPKDGGTCGNFTVKNFFDVEYGACSRFWYSGCGGNDNRFETFEECKSTCEQAEGKGACLLPKNNGPCTGHYPSFYYDTDRNMCSQFVYGGCLGNNNRFETIEACQQLCAVDRDSLSAPCDQPLDEGPCHGRFESWYFDKESDTCRQFYFGGCIGNKNRYATEASCNYHCKAPGIHKEDNVLRRLQTDRQSQILPAQILRQILL